MYFQMHFGQYIHEDKIYAGQSSLEFAVIVHKITVDLFCFYLFVCICMSVAALSWKLAVTKLSTTDKRQTSAQK